MLESIKRSSFAMLEQLQIDIDNKVKRVGELSNSIVFDKKIEMFLKGDYSLFSHKDIMEDMMTYPKYEFIYDYYIYSTKYDEIITATIKSSSKPFYHMMCSYEGMNYDVWYDTILSKYHFNTYLPARQLNAYGSEKYQVITYIQSIPVNMQSEILGQAVILIDQSKINRSIDKISWATEGHIYVIDKRGNIVITSKDAPILSNDLLDRMTLSDSILDYKTDEGDSVVLYQTSQDTNWKYVIVMPESAFLAEINRTKTFTFVLLMSFLVIGIILAYIFAYHNYQPIKEIKEMVTRKTNMGVPQYKNEFEYIKSSIVNIFENQNKLNEVISSQLPIMRSDYLTKLLKGYMGSIDTDSDTLEFMQIEFMSSSFMVMLVEISDVSSFFANHTEKEWALARFVIENVGTEIVEDAFTQYFVELDRNRTAFIVNLPPDVESTNFIEELKGYIDKFDNVLSDVCGISACFGVSEIHNNIVELRECYDEALKSLDYSILIGEDNIVFFNELTFRDIYYYYPIEMEVQLMNMLRAGDYEGVEETIDTLFEINFKSRNIGLEASRYFVIDILTTLMKVMNTLQAQNDEAFLSMDSLMDITTRYDNVDVIRQQVQKVAYDICNLVHESYMNPSERLIMAVEEYIEEHYCENWLSLTAIADNFDVTPQYLSSLFKKHRGENITDFISKLKVEKAKQLLVTTDLTISEIGCQLGYANDMGITRVFKKYEGITPGVYREQQRS